MAHTCHQSHLQRSRLTLMVLIHVATMKNGLQSKAMPPGEVAIGDFQTSQKWRTSQMFEKRVFVSIVFIDPGLGSEESLL